jgi:Protein of unknown function (DUF4058)
MMYHQLHPVGETKMPSPFPGMDPYLENPELWPDVHHELISQLRKILNERIRPKYVARVEVRVYLSDEDDLDQDLFVPDLKIERRHENGNGAINHPAPAQSSGSIMMLTKLSREVKEPRLEILEAGPKRLVTVVEVLSPANKRRGSRGRKEFLDKREEIMNSPSNWVEIDLLRAGAPTVSRRALLACDYLVHVSRKQQRPKGEVWPIALNGPLPEIRIPLLPEDQESLIDLGEVLRESYQSAAYDLSIDYKADPVPPLNPEAADWADRLLREKGLR